MPKHGKGRYGRMSPVEREERLDRERDRERREEWKEVRVVGRDRCERRDRWGRWGREEKPKNARLRVAGRHGRHGRWQAKSSTQPRGSAGGSFKNVMQHAGKKAEAVVCMQGQGKMLPQVCVQVNNAHPSPTRSFAMPFFELRFSLLFFLLRLHFIYY